MKIVRPLLFVVMSAGLFYALLGNIPLHSASRSQAYFNDLLHFPLGMVFYALLHFAFRHRIAERWLFLAAILAQGLFEIAQPMVGRSASWLDLILALSGMVFLWCCCGWLPRVTSRVGRVLLGGALLGGSIAPGLVLLQDERAQIRNLPHIADFEAWMESTRWKAQRGVKSREQWPENETGYGLVFEVERPDNYPGVYCEFGGQDWSAYQQLNLKIVLRGQEQVLVTVRLDDLLAHGSYTKRLDETFLLQAGRNDLTIDIHDREKPNGERFDFEQVQRTIIHLSGAQIGTQILLDAIQLQ